MEHPCHILIDVCSIDDDEEIVVAHLVYQKVVDGASVRIEHHAIENLMERCILDVVGEDMVYIFLGIRTSYYDFAHVAYVEDSAMISHRLMFVNDR